MCSEPGKLVIGSHVSSLSRGKSRHPIRNFWEEEYKFNLKTSDQLQSVIDKKNTRNEKNAQTQRDRNTDVDMDEGRADGDDDDGTGYSEDDHGEDEDGTGNGGDGTVSHSKRRVDGHV